MAFREDFTVMSPTRLTPPSNAPSDWYVSFFSGLVVDFWIGALPPEVTAAEAAFLERHLHTVTGSRVLDVPCGHGRLALALAARGCRVTGIDISEELLEAAEAAQASSHIPGPVWKRADMRDLPRTGEFDAAFCCGSSFGFLRDEGDREFLSAVSHALCARGRFVLDGSKAAECILPAFQERRVLERGGIRFESENRYDARAGRIENRYTLSRGEERETKLASHRVYTASQLCGMLEDAGFAVLDLFGSTDDAPFGPGSPQLFLVCEKRGT